MSGKLIFQATLLAAVATVMLSSADASPRSGLRASHAQGGTHSVRGYVKRNGTVVRPHQARNPTR